MRQYRAGDAEFPTPEQLTAYIDGELDAAQRMRVERWVSNHPEAAAEVDEYRHLARLWQATTPIEPDGAKWVPILDGVECGFLRSRALDRGRQRLLRVGMTIALAAAVLLVLLWRPTADSVSVEPLTVVSADDVEIVSLRAADRSTLVVGVPPVTEPLALASRDDVEFERLEPDGDGMIADIQMDEKSDAVIIAAPPSATVRRAKP
jgi:anti-sigma factor RsiW